MIRLPVYEGRPVGESAVYEWCRRSPYHMRWTGRRSAVSLRRGADVVAAGSVAVELWPAFVERLRAIALTV